MCPTPDIIMASAVPASSTYSPNIVFGTSNMNFLKHRYINMIKTPPYVSFKKIKMRTCCIEIRKKIYFHYDKLRRIYY